MSRGRPRQLQHCRLRPQSALLLLLLAAALLHTTAAAAVVPAYPALIVRFTDQALQKGKTLAAAAAAVSTASVAPDAAAAAVSTASVAPDAAAAAAAARAAARGESRQGQQRVAALAAASAAVTPAVNALADSISIRSRSSNARIKRYIPITTVFQGASIVLESNSSSEELRNLKQELESSPLVQKVWISRPVNLPTPVKQTTPAKTAAAAAAARGTTAYSDSAFATGLNALWRQYPNLNGSKTLICVIDTGLNYKLPIFGDCSAVGQPAGSCKVVTGYDFVGDDYDGAINGPAAAEDNDPMDCFGHGTAVASVAATRNGVASDALLGAYRVFGCFGSSTEAIIVPAIDRAVRDGCHIINLSLSAESGYAEGSPYEDVMKAAWEKGVLAVKAAGNEGSPVDANWFSADVTVAVGAASVGSVGSGLIPVNNYMTVSDFSCFGPHPELLLGPHTCAPGSDISVMSIYGFWSSESGTSLSSPYTAGLLALWRQYKESEAAKSNKSLDVDDINQDVLLDQLTVTSKPVFEGSDTTPEPVLRCGGGVIQADAFITNQLRITPSMLSLPSSIRSPYKTTLTLTWHGPRHPNRFVTYDVTHQPAYSVPLDQGWYGNRYRQRRQKDAAVVKLQPQQVVIDTDNPADVEIQVTFSLPAGLRNEALLYSGYIIFTPTKPTRNNGTTTVNCTSTGNSSTIPESNSTGTNCTTAASGSTTTEPVLPTVPEISVPYQGFSRPYQSLRIMAQPQPDDASLAAASSDLVTHASSICYSPGSRPSTPGGIQDTTKRVPNVCTGGIASSDDQVLNVSLRVLRNSPECSLRATLAPEVPLKWLNVSVIDAASDRIFGYLDPIFTGSSNSLADARRVQTWCLLFNGTLTGRTGVTRRVQIGKTYKFRALINGPVAAGDAADGKIYGRQRVDLRGMMQIVR